MNQIEPRTAETLKTNLGVSNAEPTAATLARGIVSVNGVVIAYADANDNLVNANGAPIGSATTVAACRGATTANVTIATALNNGDTLDGLTLATDDRILVKDQTDPAENGIYIVGATPTRATDFDKWSEVPGRIVSVLEGTANTGLSFLSSAAVSGTVGTTNISFVPFPSGAGFTSPTITTSILTADASFTAFAGATTLLTIGGTGASASLFAPSTLDTSSSTTGAIRTSGGISAAKAANFGTTLTVGTTSSLVGDVTLGGALVGPVSATLLNTVSTTIAFGAAASTSITMGHASGDVIITAGELLPAADDGTALGKTTKQFSDLFLASGAVLNYANGNVVLTHSSGILTVGTGDLRITTAGTNTASAVTVGGTQTLTNKTLTNPTINNAAVARTATADGLTTGTIADLGFIQHITVTSASADDIIVLPTPTPGVQVILNVGANGFELRSSTPASVGINGGTGASAESAIPANSTVFMTCVSATSWKGFYMDADGDLAKVEAAA